MLVLYTTDTAPAPAKTSHVPCAGCGTGERCPTGAPPGRHERASPTQRYSRASSAKAGDPHPTQGADLLGRLSLSRHSLALNCPLKP